MCSSNHQGRSSSKPGLAVSVALSPTHSHSPIARYLIRHKRGRKSKRKLQEVLWFVLRQDTFVQKSRGNRQSVRLEAYSGKTLKNAWALDVGCCIGSWKGCDVPVL